MSYLGLQPNTPLLNTSTETFSGNSVATQFNLARSVASASDLDVMVGSTLQRPFADYIAGNVSLQFISAPATGVNNITVTYRAGALNSLDLTVSTFNAGTAAAPGVVSLAANNTGLYWANASSLVVTTSGSDRVAFNANTTSTSTTSGALVVYGGAGIDGNIFIQGLANITNPTESSSVSTGSFITAGGAGIAGNLNVGGDITCVGDFTVNGTFTTTGTDSLAVTDPFIFLANNNPGDTYDSGVITQFYDGANIRYSGYFRDITDAKYKLFTNLLTQPTTTVDTTDPSFRYTDLILANLSATGNVAGTYLLGNGSLLTGISTTSSNIFNANTSVAIAAVNANVNMVINSVQIANVWSGGISVVGAVTASTSLSATGNIIGGNVQTAGLITATGNITSAANVSAGNVLTGGVVSSTGNITGGNIIGTTAVSTGGNVQAGNIRTSGLMSAAGDVYGNNFSATNGVTAGGLISAVGDITGGNVNTAGVVSATGNVIGAWFVGSVAGNVIGTTVSVTGNVTGGNLNAGSGAVSTTGNVAGGNVIATTLAQTATLSATGAVTFSGTTQNIAIGTSQTTGNVTVGGATQTGTILIGQSTNPQTINIGHGATGTGNTKTIQIGENGLAGSTTLIDIGPVTATTAAGTATFNTATVVAIANTSGTALSVAGNITGANVNTGGAISATGTITGGNLATGGTTSAVGNITGGNIITGGAVSAASVSASGTIIGTGNITGANFNTGGLVTATGNVTGGNINTAGLISATGNITSAANIAATNFIGIHVGNVVGTTVSVTGNITGGNLNAAGLSLSGNVVSGIATTANITGGNILTSGVISSTGNITGGNILGGANVNATTHTGTTVSVTSTVTGSQFNGSGAGLTSIPGANVTGTVPSATTAGTVTTAAQGNITSVGTLTGLTINNATTAIINGGTNGVGNIGATGATFNIVFAKATTAQYADLAEYYAADAEYSPGTVLSFGGDQEVTIATGINDVRVAGVVSTNPAYAMNTAIEAEHTVALALTGRVPAMVIGAVAKGDMMVSAGGGRAKACATPIMGSVIGKAVQDHPGGPGTIEIVVGRL